MLSRIAIYYYGVLLVFMAVLEVFLVPLICYIENASCLNHC